jgi:hypothetical protein
MDAKRKKELEDLGIESTTSRPPRKKKTPPKPMAERDAGSLFGTWNNIKNHAQTRAEAYVHWSNKTDAPTIDCLEEAWVILQARDKQLEAALSVITA